ncbi:Ff.00g058930.m01.CDS01 [Fusarium sp. VM40]|nr:Ff.00g058930.m01.CDS01 [Fusarium sp. VM40]
MFETSATLFPGVAFATSGIGHPVAVPLAKEGCGKIAGFDKNEETLVDAEVQPWEVDNLKTDEVIQHMTLAFKHFGRIDYAVNYAVNCVCPGVIKTPMTADVPDDDPAVQNAVMKRKGTPQEVTRCRIVPL